MLTFYGHTFQIYYSLTGTTARSLSETTYNLVKKYKYGAKPNPIPFKYVVHVALLVSRNVVEVRFRA